MKKIVKINKQIITNKEIEEEKDVCDFCQRDNTENLYKCHICGKDICFQHRDVFAASYDNNIYIYCCMDCKKNDSIKQAMNKIDGIYLKKQYKMKRDYDLSFEELFVNLKNKEGLKNE